MRSTRSTWTAGTSITSSCGAQAGQRSTRSRSTTARRSVMQPWSRRRHAVGPPSFAPEAGGAGRRRVTPRQPWRCVRCLPRTGHPLRARRRSRVRAASRIRHATSGPSHPIRACRRHRAALTRRAAEEFAVRSGRRSRARARRRAARAVRSRARVSGRGRLRPAPSPPRTPDCSRRLRCPTDAGRSSRRARGTGTCPRRTCASSNRATDRARSCSFRAGRASCFGLRRGTLLHPDSGRPWCSSTQPRDWRARAAPRPCGCRSPAPTATCAVLPAPSASSSGVT